MSIMTQSSDSVSFKHPEYIAYMQQIAKCKDIYEGIDTAKKHLYKLERESDLSYNTRLDNATLKNFVKRATEAFVGMIYRKHIETTGLNDAMIEILDSVDRTNNINKFARDLTTSVVVSGKAFIAVDSSVDGTGLPYAVIYDRSQVINWNKDSNGRYTRIIVQEAVEEPSGEFGVEYVNQYRVYKENGNVDIYREVNSAIVLVDTITTEYDYIPIIAIDLSDVPPLYDVAKMTIKHMNRSSIKDKYLDMAATPVPLIWGIGIDESVGSGTKPVFVVGADEAFLFQGTKDECDFQWRELSGSSIDKLQEDLSVIEEDITSGIIRAATSDTTTIKTATQSFYEAAESANRVTVIAQSVEQALNKMLSYLADIANTEIEPTAGIIVNKDFNAVTGNNQDLRLLWEVYLGGTLSAETFIASLAKYEVIDIGSVRDEIERINKDKFLPKPKVAPDATVTAMDNNTVSADKKANIIK